MAEIRPFRGLRFDAAIVGDLAAVMTPPYDVIDAAAQAEYYRRSEHNIIRLELGEQYPGDSAQDNRYTRAAACFQRWPREGVLRAEPAPAIYVYQHGFAHGDRQVVRTGFIAAMRLEEFRKGSVLPHEATMAGPKMDRLRLMRATGANFSPIFALFEDKTGAARDALARVTTGAPAMAFWSNGEEHRLWVVDDPQVGAALCSTSGAGPVFIADGHHRYETALFYRDEQRAANPKYRGDEAWNFVMTLLVAVEDAGLVVLPTHRLVNPRDPQGDALAELFAVAELPAREDEAAGMAEMQAGLARLGEAGPVFGCYGLLPGRFAILAPRSAEIVERLMPSDRSAAWRRLDVSVLHELLLRRVCGLAGGDFEDEARITYTRDEVAARQAVAAGRYRLAVFLNPTPVGQVLEVARAREVMPHKATYFHPKPLTGPVISRLTDTIA